eukprot:TRINITY_DN4726_c0_g1_i1.p1 TRINITY_DN4726_c0_g1~~TRINITY_DN4726_c0_g1_i1.p1  ORF type:complete len:429 (+),score=147.61 TRINITY_DN4726_c0_g1_i1:1-1287(+)
MLSKAIRYTAPQRLFRLPVSAFSSQKLRPLQKTSLQISINHQPGKLADALAIFTKYGVNLTKIESRRHQTGANGITILFDFEGLVVDPKIQTMLSDLKRQCQFVGVIDSYEAEPFPRHPSDMDIFAGRCSMAGEDLESDHPGFHDKEYRKRRMSIADIALTYKHGEEIPLVEYTKEEIQTWGKIFHEFVERSNQHACSQYQSILPLLVENCGYREDNIPQLRDISKFLESKTGFTVRPVTGLLSSRDFLNALAFKVFFSTQYIRHHSKPDYTPEPDICHELLGHVPMFADPDFADFSQEIGIASLGASEEALKRLATCYWFTIEYGVCKQKGHMKAYGAGILSSYGEMQHCFSSVPQFKPFDPEVAAQTEYPITTFQPTYFVTESFQKMKEQMREFSQTLGRRFDLRYNPYTKSIEFEDTPFFTYRHY